ncbi:hypothetical protein MarSH_403 [Marseillevirus Shanghai 1]|nr:hypothetical protein MarSH_403 [Marseillevirus Shanghai 1]
MNMENSLWENIEEASGSVPLPNEINWNFGDGPLWEEPQKETLWEEGVAFREQSIEDYVHRESLEES